MSYQSFLLYYLLILYLLSCLCNITNKLKWILKYWKEAVKDYRDRLYMGINGVIELEGKLPLLLFIYQSIIAIVNLYKNNS